MKTLMVRVPASSANLGPGFDALSLSLSLHLTIHVQIGNPLSSPSIILSYTGVNPNEINSNIEANLITKTIMHVVNRTTSSLPNNEIYIKVNNDIPLSKGLGSSAAAVTAGCVIANELCGLKLSKLQLLKYALEIENHPDNLSAAFFGGFVVSCVDSVSGECYALSTQVSKNIQATVVVPDIEKKSTAAARAVLPNSYTRAEAVFNIQRAAVLTSLLSNDRQDIDTSNIFAVAMQDKIHQPYRQHLVPGLEAILQLPNSLKPACKSFLGVCMSGAGPSVLILTKNGDETERARIAQAVKDCFAGHNVSSVAYTLEIDNTGTWCNWQE